MKLNQICTVNPKIQQLLNTIEGQRTAYSLIPVKPDLSHHLRRHSLLRSALYSAKIEGINEDTDTNKLAIQNLEHTYSWLYAQPANLDINSNFIKALHSKSLHNLRGDAGSFRVEQSAIFNSAGVAVYLTPPPSEIKTLLESWQKFYSNLEYHPLVQAIIAHYQFEKIHPFIDGNGRVGRLILTQQLRHSSFDFGGILAIEEAIDSTRSDYYYHLQNESKDVTLFIEYFLNLIHASATKVLSKITQPGLDQTTHSLLPRRQELLNILHDHKVVSFDFLHRRFAGIPSSTLRYDLLALQKGGYIKKLGVTRGSLYAPV